MKISYLVRSIPGSITPDPDSGEVKYQGIGESHLVDKYNDGANDWDVWFLYVIDEDPPVWQPNAGDTILGGWDRYDMNKILVPEHPDLFDYVRPIGNPLNEETSTYDGTPDFAYYTNGLGAPSRWWGNTNQAPDDNQTRHVECYRYTTDFGGQDYHRCRFILQEPLDKDNAPNALAILIYQDPERQQYFYTPGAFIWNAEFEYWYADTTIGQSPTSGPEPVYYCVALGAAPLSGGGTVPPEYNEPRTEPDFQSGVPANPEHVSYNWEENLSAAQQTGLELDDWVEAFRTRIGWQGFTSFPILQYLVINNVNWGSPLIFVSNNLARGTWSFIPPHWMTPEQQDQMTLAIEKAAGRETMNAAA